MTIELKNFSELRNDVGNKKTLVFGGFSGLGYAKPEMLESKIKERIRKSIKESGVCNLAVISGATSDGIGAVYKIAKELGVSTYGIVSELAKEYGVDPNCEKTFFVPDPTSSWMVLSETRDSYIVDIAENGFMIYYGGGEVALSEIKEAEKKGIKLEVDISFQPNPEKVKDKKLKSPGLDPEPLKTYFAKKDIS